MKKLLLPFLLAAPTLLFAQGSQVNTQSQKLVGMSGAGSALFIDESSIFYSPGALAKMDGNAVSIGGSGIMYKSGFQQINSNAVHRTRAQVSTPFSVFATFGPDNSWWKAGIGVYTPFGGGVDWGTDWPGKFELNHLSMRAIYIQPTVSFKLTENFSVGGGFVYNIGSVDLAKSLPIFMENGETAQARLSGTGTGMGYNIGVHYHLEDQVAISLSYRSKVVTRLEGGDAEFTAPSSLAALLPNTTFNAELPLPASFNFGISIPLSTKFDLVGDATLIGYDIYKVLSFDYKDNTSLLDDTEEIKKYENAFSGKIGINYKPSAKLALRAGTGYVFTPVSDPYVSPETPDNNRVMLSGGLTYNFSDKVDLSAAYVFQRIEPRTVSHYKSGLTGTYKTNIHAPGISLTYKW